MQNIGSDKDELDKIMDKVAILQGILEESDFYSIDSKIEAIAYGIGIRDFLMRNPKNLSGGQRSKVILAKLLLEEPDILLLDEPTNHLDKENIEWLKFYLKNYKNAFILISHDTEFMNDVVNVIYNLEISKVKHKPHFEFIYSKSPYNLIFKAKNLVIGYDKMLTKSLNLKMEKHDKISIIGANGIGKTTLLKSLMGIINHQYINNKYVGGSIHVLKERSKYNMPELPEVERIKRIIEPQIKNRKIVGLTMNRPDIIAHPLSREFYSSIINKTITNMSRRGKFLIINLSNLDKIILHLRMTGQLIVTPADFPHEKHTHLIFNLDDGKELRFIDTRRFGRFWLLHKNEEDIYSGIEKLGIEPFDKEFCAKYLKEKLGKSNKAIKECLIDQSVVTGIGNIYGDEILFDASICPKRKAASLSDDEWKSLAKSIPKILKSAIEDYKITPQEYLEGKGKEYGNSELIQIYGHQNKPCPHCNTLLTKTIISRRSSTYCPSCQKE